MSDPASFDVVRDNPADRGIEAFTRWPGLLSLSLGWVLGPILALVNQQLIYAANMYACGRNLQYTEHVIPALCLIATIGVGWQAYRDWNAAGAGVEDEEATVATRTRFISLVGMALSVFSAAVIIAQWSTIFVFDPCMRA
jgi:hypothetical protein